ncbi:MAG TPA: hypothetical protein VFJ06_08570 [Halococcus sp.]|nr:hypothetical protein [Halococcus sp.]
MSRNYPSFLHRLCNEPTDQSEPTEKHPTGRYHDVIQEVGEAIDTLDDFEEGDGVVWRPPQKPLEVVEVGADECDRVHLLGPRGGEYQLQRAEKVAGAYAVVPGYGCIRELYRVVPEDDWPQLERV